MSYTNHLMDHSNRVAHSSSWYEPDDPIEDPPELKKSDFSVLVTAGLKCPICGEDLKETCDYCGEPFESKNRVGISCGKEKARKLETGHICHDCWSNLPDGGDSE